MPSPFPRLRPLLAAVLCAVLGLPARAEPAPVAPAEVAAPAPAQAGGLAFAHQRVLVAAELGAPSVFAEYPFVNRGDKTITVLALTATCGCTVPSLEKLAYAPGEGGAVRARFDIGDRQGKQAKRITVRTDAGEQFLDLVVDLPRRIEFKPRLALFRPGDLAPKAITITFDADAPVTVLEVVANHSAFTLARRDDEPGKRLTFTASLAGDVAPSVDTRATYRIRTRGASGREYNDTFFVRYIP